MRVLFHAKFLKMFKRLPEKKKTQCKERLRLFEDHPFHPMLRNHALRGKYEEFHSINITGDMRALYKMINDDTVEFVYLDTHSKLY